jgi:hypothetical protein
MSSWHTKQYDKGKTYQIINYKIGKEVMETSSFIWLIIWTWPVGIFVYT